MALSATAQTGRTMRLLAPVVIGQSSGFVMDHPPSIAGNSFGFAMCSPTFPGAIPVSVPGVVEGVLRLTPLAYSILGIGVLDSSGVSAAFTFSVPNDPLLVGASMDVQGADVNGFGLMTLTDNDLELVVGPVAPAPPASLNMVSIDPGTFQMGSVAVGGDAVPVHAVTITQSFWMGKYEVTQGEYQAVMGSNPSTFQGAAYPNFTNRPVDRVSWASSVAYCDALTSQEAAAGRLPLGYEYRLPTEAEWEYCCRAGTTTEWNVGSSLICGQANFFFCIGGQTGVVGSYAANAWGLHDMHGNLVEWCLDSWDQTANYLPGSVADPFVAAGPKRMARGGCWTFGSDDCRSSIRIGFGPNSTYDYVGFRVVCAPVLP